MERGEGGDFSQLFSTSVLFLKKISSVYMS